ncbi:MAG: hypothetical protein QHH07_08815 [Sedimentisphaerales bacterium]|jgi:hypothetical protein|nr:hypothetical protein [Sedimentisphaerales bacterium]
MNKWHHIIKAALPILLFACLGTRLAGQDLASNVLIPSSRIYGYAADQQILINIPAELEEEYGQ